MTQVNKLEKLGFQFLVAALAIICFIPGGVATFGGINASTAMATGDLILSADSMLNGFVDNQYRFGFGVFFAQGLVLLFFLSNITEHRHLFRFAALALFIGGVGRLTNIVEHGVLDDQVVGPTVIELVAIPLLVLWHLRIMNKLKAA